MSNPRSSTMLVGVLSFGTMKIMNRIRAHLVPVAFAVLFRPDRPIQLVRLGSDYGGWWIPEEGLGPSSICYLAGVGTDISFDISLIKRLGCSAWGIDPTPMTIEWLKTQEVPETFTFVPVGLAGQSGELKFFAPVNPDHVSHSIKNLQGTSSYFLAKAVTVRQLMEKLGHEHVSLLKLDIEGAEHDVLANMISERIFPDVLCIEFDQPEPIVWARNTVRLLRREGYSLVGREGLNFTFIRD